MNPRDFNQSITAPIREAIQKLELELFELRERIRLHGTYKEITDHPAWQPIFEMLSEVERMCVEVCSTKRLGEYEQGMFHGRLRIVRMLTRRPFRDEQEYLTALHETMPGLQQQIEAHKRLLGPRENRAEKT